MKDKVQKITSKPIASPLGDKRELKKEKMEITENTMNELNSLLTWFKPGTTIGDLFDLDSEGHIDLGQMLYAQKNKIGIFA